MQVQFNNTSPSFNFIESHMYQPLRAANTPWAVTLPEMKIKFTAHKQSAFLIIQKLLSQGGMRGLHSNSFCNFWKQTIPQLCPLSGWTAVQYEGVWTTFSSSPLLVFTQLTAPWTHLRRGSWKGGLLSYNLTVQRHTKEFLGSDWGGGVASECGH